MRFLVDANLPRSVIVVLQNMGHQIVRVLERFLINPEFLQSLAGRLAIVEVDRVRFRPPVEL